MLLISRIRSFVCDDLGSFGGYRILRMKLAGFERCCFDRETVEKLCLVDFIEWPENSYAQVTCIILSVACRKSFSVIVLNWNQLLLLLVVKYRCFLSISSSQGIIFGKSALGEENALFLILFSPSYFSFLI